MAEDDSADKEGKTEAPTEHKLRKAREQGDVPASREAGTLMAVAALFAIVAFVLPQGANAIAGTLAGVLDAAGRIEIGTGPAGLRDLGAVVGALVRGLALPLLSIFGTLILAALFAILIQGETVVAVERIRPKLSKLSPLGGARRIFSGEGLAEFAKSLAKVLVVGVVSVLVARDAITAIWRGPGLPPEDLAGYIDRFAGRALLVTAAILLPLTIGDILWKRLAWLRRQRMSITEMKDERKEQEGDPKLKAQRLQIGRRRARQRAAQAVPKATLVLTNPTHFAVALRYEHGVDAAPVCVAKGSDLLARRIREIAQENGVPVIENPPLARLLFARVEVDQMVPVDQWQAVAEIVGYVLDLRRRIRRRPPAGSSLRLED